MTRPDILIAGIGNIFLGDDAFGCETARCLLDLHGIDGVQVVDFGIRGIDLAYALADRCDVAILIDAAPRQSPPGTLHLLELDLDDLGGSSDGGSATEPALLDAHSMDPLKVLRLVRSMEGRVQQVFLVGCEPAELAEDEDGRMGLSAPLQSAVARAVAMVKSLLAEIRKRDDERCFLAAGKGG